MDNWKRKPDGSLTNKVIYGWKNSSFGSSIVASFIEYGIKITPLLFPQLCII